MKPNIILKSRFTVPIYDSELWIIVAHDAQKAFNRMAKRFNDKPGKDEFAALCVDDEKSTVGLFFHAKTLTEETLGHEISHAVDSILRHVGHKCPNCDEPRAYLNGYLTKRVRALLKKHKITIQRG